MDAERYENQNRGGETLYKDLKETEVQREEDPKTEELEKRKLDAPTPICKTSKKIRPRLYYLYKTRLLMQ